MTIAVAQIWRHPIKGHGAEPLDRVTLEAGRTMPGDRTWAVAHAHAKTDGTEWAPCPNYSRGAKAPSLMAIEAQLDEATATVRLRHPDRPDITFQPDDDADAARFLDWVAPLVPADRPQSVRIDRAPGRGMTDSPFPSVSLAGTASLRALSDKVGRRLDPRRFRQNIWLDGLAPFEELDWVGREIAIGAGMRARVVEPIERCLATSANPDTGRRDVDTLGALEAGWGHRDLGVYLEVFRAGAVAVGDRLTLL